MFFFLTCLAQPASGRILYVNSYHDGYASSDEITRGIRAALAGSGVALRVFLMDTKRRTSEAEIEEKVKEALDLIDHYRPSVLIVSDDAAAKYLVAPHLKDGPLPVVFCGVNWSAEQYGFPTAWVTGMLEVVPVFETIEVVRKQYPTARRMCFLTEDSLSERNNQRFLDPLFKERGLEVTYALVRDFASWKAAFLEASEKDDFIYLSTNGAIQEWNDAEARTFVLQNIRKPVVACDDFMMAFAAFGLAKVAREQGEWAASTALAFLGGKKPGGIPITRNQRTKAYVNLRLAAKIGFPSDSRLLQQCEKVN